MRTLGIVAGIVGTCVAVVAGVGVWFLAGRPAPAEALLAAPAQLERRAINLPGRTTQAPFSDAILAGDTLYLSGRLGMDPATGQPPAEAQQEARIFCSDVAHYADFNTVYSSYFTRDPPARAFVGSGALLRGARFEVMGIAVRRP